MTRMSIYAAPDILLQLKRPTIVYSPSLIAATVESEFNIPAGQLWFKTNAPQFSIARYAFLYIMQNKLGLEPNIIRVIYGAKHDKCYQARLTIQNILDSKTPRHTYIKVIKIRDKIKQWDLTEISQKLELYCAGLAEAQAQHKSMLEYRIREALAIQQKNAQSVMEQAELSEQ